MRVSTMLCCFLSLNHSIPSMALAASDRYEFLKGSQWYVPTATLPAISVDPSTAAVTPLIDQTVWNITGYQSGYFTGVSIALFQSPTTGTAKFPVSCTDMVGSVTPSGVVLISFFNPSDPNAAANATIGTGTLAKEANGVWRFTMQMTTGSRSVIAHWSYMNQCKKGEACVGKLPGADLSLQSFIAQCQG
jgi:hypothetical protein